MTLYEAARYPIHHVRDGHPHDTSPAATMLCMARIRRRDDRELTEAMRTANRLRAVIAEWEAITMAADPPNLRMTGGPWETVAALAATELEQTEAELELATKVIDQLTGMP